MLVQGLLGLVSATAVLATHSTVNVWLQSSWDAPPLILEVLESVANEDPALYFPLLTALSAESPSLAQQSPRQQLESIIDLIQESPEIFQGRPKWDLSSFQASIAMHATTPKIQAYYQYYDTSINQTAAGNSIGQICESWVEWNGKGFCDVDELRKDIELSLTEAGSLDVFSTLWTKVLPFDHIFPSNDIPVSHPPAILYLAGLSKSEGDLLASLKNHASQIEDFRFIVRYRPSLAREQGSAVTKNSLKGYGVEMVLKRTDYLTVDDRETDKSNAIDREDSFTNGTSSPTQNRYAEIFGTDPWADLGLNPLRAAEISELGLKSASLVLRDDAPLEALIHISQDFPKLAAGLARKVSIDENLARDVAINQQSMRMPNTIWVNGRFVGPLEANALSLLDIIREERHRALSLCALGLTPQQAFEILSDDSIGDALNTLNPMDSLVDSSDRPEGGNVIQWWNNIEKDSRYTSWPDSLSVILVPQRPGGFQPVRKNLWNVVLVLDLSTKSGLHTISQTVGNLIRRGIPFRFGVVPWSTSDVSSPSAVMARHVRYMIKYHGRGQTLDYISNLLLTNKQPNIDIRQAEALFDASYSAAEGAPGKRFKEIIQEPEGIDYYNKTKYWLTRLAVNQESPSGHVFFNGQHHLISELWLQQVMQDHSSQLAYLQKPANAKLARKAKNVSTFFYDLSTTSRRRNLHIIPGNGHTRLRVFDNQAIFPEGTPLQKHFVYPEKGQQAVSLLSTMVIGDLDSDEGWQMAREVLRYLEQNADSELRLGFYHSPSHKSSRHLPFRMSTLLYRLYSTGELSLVRPADFLLLDDILANEVEDQDPVSTISRVVERLPTDSVLREWLSLEEDPLTLAASRHFWATLSNGRHTMGINAGLVYLLVNGRLLGPLESNAFTTEDFAALERHELNTRARPILRALQNLYQEFDAFDGLVVSNIVNGLASTIGAAYSLNEGSLEPRTNVYRQLRGEHSSFRIGQQQTALAHVYAIIDPLSEAAQKIAPLLKMATDLEHTFVHVQLNPKQEMDDLPLKRFYRYALETKPTFTVEGEFAAAGASFTDLPSEPIFTLGMDVPHSWLVAPRKSVHDLDNLRLDAILSRQESPVIDLHFELEQFVVDGHAKEGDTSEPPRGLQLQLSSLNGQPIGDTMVMANAGYLQFKANPGVMSLGIRDPRGREVYTLKSASTTSTAPAAPATDIDTVYLTGFSGATLFPTFTRNPGMEQADVLDMTPARQEGGLLRKVVTSLSIILGSKEVVKHQPHADINIFTVASGLLYERFASIMILSVLNHTNSTVKFWFIKNFLSPSFLEFIPSFAEKYGFKYELVTYKWPSWLRAQKEKQREIWGYKILFLDVLFPLDLDKIIFVDADQIVRTDLKELIDLDLQGRVYGYAPMGDDREDMEGFRFWKTGYWRESLRGRPYHISALYVVDLKRFRQLAAGDRLRAQYQALSADPNSLANLDQDLPNAMQDILPIYTLDRSWLWCETWCSQESLKDAKTIDLCQNPMTKEPKLDRARKIPEWEAYDAEVAAFAKGLQASHTIALTDVEVLTSPDRVVVPSHRDSLDVRDASKENGNGVDEATLSAPIKTADGSALGDMSGGEDKHQSQHRSIDEL